MNNSMFDVSRLINLTELRLLESSGDMDIVAKNLSKLERLVFFNAKLNAIRPFIRHSKQLKEIRIRGWEFVCKMDVQELEHKIGKNRASEC